MIDLNTNTPDYEAIELLYRSYRTFTDRADRILEKRGLGRAHHRILYFIARHQNGSVADLLNSLVISKQALNVPLRQLISMELVESKRASTDARVKQLRLTATGKRLEARLSTAQTKLLNQVFEESSPNAEDGWREIMRALANA